MFRVFREIGDFEIGSVNCEVGSGGRNRHGEGFDCGENAGRLLLLPLVDL